jgi:hypothetical protein
MVCCCPGTTRRDAAPEKRLAFSQGTRLMGKGNNSQKNDKKNKKPKKGAVKTDAKSGKK